MKKQTTNEHQLTRIRQPVFISVDSYCCRSKLVAGAGNFGPWAARSVWSAWSLLPLFNDLGRSTAGASSTHSKRFALPTGQNSRTQPAISAIVVRTNTNENRLPYSC